MVHSVFLKSVNTQQSQILFADYTIDGCVIATVVDKGLTGAHSDCGGARVGDPSDHHHLMHGYIGGCICRPIYDFGWLAVRGFSIEKHLLPLEAVF